MAIAEQRSIGPSVVSFGFVAHDYQAKPEFVLLLRRNGHEKTLVGFSLSRSKEGFVFASLIEFKERPASQPTLSATYADGGKRPVLPSRAQRLFQAQERRWIRQHCR